MKPQLPFCLLIAIFNSAAIASEPAEPIANPLPTAKLPASIVAELPELHNEVAELAQQRLQRKDEVLAAKLAEETANKLQRFAAISE